MSVWPNSALLHPNATQRAPRLTELGRRMHALLMRKRGGVLTCAACHTLCRSTTEEELDRRVAAFKATH